MITQPTLVLGSLLQLPICRASSSHLASQSVTHYPEVDVLSDSHLRENHHGKEPLFRGNQLLVVHVDGTLLDEPSCLSEGLGQPGGDQHLINSVRMLDRYVTTEPEHQKRW